MKDDWKQVFAVGQPPVTAIDVLLEPDTTMLRHAEANNVRLLKIYPKGFALDGTHRPHITMLQCFVRTADLDKVYAAVGKVLAGVSAPETGRRQILLHPGRGAWRRGHCRETDARTAQVASGHHCRCGPVHGGNWADRCVHCCARRFRARRANDRLCVGVCSKSFGEHFNPHVTTGVAPREYLDKMLAEPFEPFTFSPAGAAVYQLGPFGAAAKKLKDWELRP